MAFDNAGTKAVGCVHPQKGVNYHFSSLQLDKPYVVRKPLDFGSLNMQFQQKNYSSLNSLQENLEKFQSIELYDAPLEGSTMFL